MRKWMTGLAIFCVVSLAGCGGARGAQAPVPAANADRPALSVPPAGNVIPRETQARRTIEDDQDADGIADYRVIITEIFDQNGNLVRTTRDEDFEADGIIDARNVTQYGD